MIFSRKGIKLKKGFTLAELIIVAAIFIIITSVALLRQSKFSSDILVTNIAYEVAIAIREAQVYGISSKQYQTGSGFENVAYGMHFSSNDLTQINLFRDIQDSNGDYDHIFDSAVGDTIEATTAFTQGHKIRRFCAYSDNNSAWHCSDGSGGQSQISTLDISFIKPNPRAYIYPNIATNPEEFSQAMIVVQSSLGDKCRLIELTQIGQVEVRPVNSDDCDFPSI